MPWPVFIVALLISMVAAGTVVALASRTHPAARPWATVVGSSVVVMPLAIVLHNVGSALIGGEEVVSFVVALVLAPGAFAVGLLGAGFALARSRDAWRVGVSLLVAGGGMTVFGFYMIGALVVTTVLNGDAPWQGPIELVILSTALLALVGGSLSAVVSSSSPLARHGSR